MKRPTFCAQMGVVDGCWGSAFDLPGTLGCSYTLGGVESEVTKDDEPRNWEKTDDVSEGRC